MPKLYLGTTLIYDSSLIDNSLSGKVDKVDGKGLSTNDLTDAYKAILDSYSSDKTEITTNASELLSKVDTHIANTNNPHSVTKDQVGLGNVTNDSQVKRSEMGVAGGVATLDTEGKVPASLLPSYVDDVLEYSSKSNFPSTGETGKIYVAIDTNLTYRWSGSNYTEISLSLALGETASTAYPGSSGKAVADDLSAHKTATNPHNITASTVGLGNVNNTSDVDKPISTSTLTALDKKVDKVTGYALSKNDFTDTYKKMLDDKAWVVKLSSSDYATLTTKDTMTFYVVV